MLGPHTITRLRAVSAEDEYHNENYDWSTPGTLDIPGCNVQPGTGNRYDDAREAIGGLVTAWVPAGSDVVATDRISYRGKVYNIDGDPEVWDFGAGHIVLRLRKVEG